MNKKYEFTGETKEVFGVTLRRIRALVAIAPHCVSAGDLGGWIEVEQNLSHNGDAWVSGDAQVSGDARVSGRIVVLTGFAHAVTITDHHIAAGCEIHPPSVWAERGAAIIKSDGHSTEEARQWAEIINLLAQSHGCSDLTEKDNAA